MIKENILIVDDDIYSTRLLSEFLSIKGMNPSVCYNGKEALEEFNRKKYPIVITDIEMPVMGGLELIERIKSINEDTVIIILSAHADSSLIVRTMKSGAYDYIVKPVTFEEVMLKIQHAEESAALKKAERIIQREKQIRLENQLEWYRWQERIMSRKIDLNDTSLFEGLRRSFTQGTGFGTLLTLLDIIASSTVDAGEGIFRIDKQLVSLLSDNIAYAKKGLRAFSEIEHIHKNNLDIKKIPVIDIYEMTIDETRKFDEQIHLKNNTFLISSPKKTFSGRFISVDYDYTRKLIHEVILNALKFSRKDAPVTIIIDIIDERFLMHVLNLPEKNEKGIAGIPEEYENIIFEPFFRMTKTLFENFRTLDYGIGLTMCEKIVLKAGGSIRVFNITDHSDIALGPQTKVCCEVTIPLDTNCG